MITLTMPRGDELTGDEFMGGVRAWLKRAVRAGWVADAGAVLVHERGERHGRAHAHAVVAAGRAFLPYAEMQAAAREVGLGVIDVQRVRDRTAVAAYVAGTSNGAQERGAGLASYVGKAGAHVPVLLGRKRVRPVNIAHRLTTMGAAAAALKAERGHTPGEWEWHPFIEWSDPGPQATDICGPRLTPD